jgi:hypothetical protein
MHASDQQAYRTQLIWCLEECCSIRCAEVHHFDVRSGRGEPLGKEVLIRDVSGEVAALVVIVSSAVLCIWTGCLRT